MKKLMLVVIMSSLSASLLAQDKLGSLTNILEQGSYSTNDEEYSLYKNKMIDPRVMQNNCEAFSKLATSIFKARQDGASASDMYRVLDNDPEEVKNIGKLIIKDVFNYPVNTSESNRDLDAKDYGNRFFTECIN